MELLIGLGAVAFVYVGAFASMLISNLVEGKKA